MIKIAWNTVPDLTFKGKLQMILTGSMLSGALVTLLLFNAADGNGLTVIFLALSGGVVTSSLITIVTRLHGEYLANKEVLYEILTQLKERGIKAEYNTETRKVMLIMPEG